MQPLRKQGSAPGEPARQGGRQKSKIRVVETPDRQQESREKDQEYGGFFTESHRM